MDILLTAGIIGTFWCSIPGRSTSFSITSVPALGLTQPPVQWVPGLLPGAEQPGREADLVLRLRTSGAVSFHGVFRNILTLRMSPPAGHNS